MCAIRLDIMNERYKVLFYILESKKFAKYEYEYMAEDTRTAHWRNSLSAYVFVTVCLQRTRTKVLSQNIFRAFQAEWISFIALINGSFTLFVYFASLLKSSFDIYPFRNFWNMIKVTLQDYLIPKWSGRSCCDWCGCCDRWDWSN